MHSPLRLPSLAAITIAACLCWNSTTRADDAPQLKLDHIPEQAVGAVFAFPQHLAAKPEMELLPVEVISAAGKRDLGFDPVQIEQAIGIVIPPIAGNPPSWGIILHFSAPQGLSEELTRRTVPSAVDTVPYFAAPSPFEPSFCLFQEKTVLVAPEATLKLMIANQSADSPLRTLLSQTANDTDLTAVFAVDAVRELAIQILSGAPPMPPAIEQLLTLPEHLDSFTIAVNFTASNSVTLKLTGRDERSAEELERILSEALAFAKHMIIAQGTMNLEVGEGAVAEATIKYLTRAGDTVENKLKPVRKGNDVTISASLNPGYASTSVLAGLLLPAVQQAREAARRTQTRNNLKQIGLAMHNYDDVFAEFPARAHYVDNKPQLSWRVLVLPYVGENELYEKFHLDEPWDSEHNKTLIKEMPAVYQNPSMDDKDFKTNYLAIAGDGTAFEGEAGRPIRQFTDGTSNTALVVEADKDQAVVWTKPDDWEFDKENPLKGLGKIRPEGFFALFADGSVRFISVQIDLDVLRALVTPDGGEVVTSP